MKGLYLAADVPPRKARKLLKEVGQHFIGVKAHILAATAARERIKMLRANGAQVVWIDDKSHDTPDTVAGLAEQYKRAGADIITVHASGGKRMMRQTVETGIQVYAVVFLTSLTNAEYIRYYKPEAPENMIEDALEAGVDGFICPPTKVSWMRHYLAGYDSSADIIVPGTRLWGSKSHDQNQVDTPGIAVRNGADYLVIGRLVTESSFPKDAVQKILDDILLYSTTV